MHSAIREIVEDAYQINFNSTEFIPVENGVIDDNILSNKKKLTLSFGMNYLREDFVEVEKGFPKEDEVEVKFGLDFIVLKGEDYRKLLKLLDKYGI